MPTPAAIEPIIKTGGKPACLDIIKMLGSAQVISAPNKNAKMITIIKFFCFDNEEPIYSPTLIKLFWAPIWKSERPLIMINAPILSIT